MGIDDLLGIDMSDPLARRARALLAAERALFRALRKIRETHELNQRDVAARMQVDQSTVARIESGTRDIRLSTLRRYAMAVGAVIDFDVRDDNRKIVVEVPRDSFLEWDDAVTGQPGRTLHASART